MVDFNVESMRKQILTPEKFPFERLEEDMTGTHHRNVPSNPKGDRHTSKLWFCNCMDTGHPMASPIVIGGSVILEDEIWPEFLPQPHSQTIDDGGNRKVRGSPLSDGKREIVLLPPSDNCDDTAEVVDDMQTAQRRKNCTHLQVTNQFFSPTKTKAVHWPDATSLENELKRQRSGVLSSSSISTVLKDSSISKTVALVQSLPVGVDSVLPEDFHHKSELDREDEFPSVGPDVDHTSDSHSLSLHGMDFEVSRVGVNITTTRVSKTASAYGSESIGENSALDLHIPTSCTTTQALSCTDFMSTEPFGKDFNFSTNVLLSKCLLPLGHGKNAAAAKSHHVQLVERHTGFRIISTPGTFADSSVPHESRWAEELLLECALAISTKNVVRTQHLMWVLNDLGCLTGDANQRLAAHGLKSLFCKVTGTGQAAVSNRRLGQVNAGPKTVHRALLKFHDVNPWHHMVYTVANSVMIDNFEGEEKVHVVDIGVSQGTQWPTFIEALATRASGPPLLRLTVVKDDERADTPAVPQGTSSTDFMVQLERFAKLMGIKIELQTVVSSLENLTSRKLGLKEGEALAICAQFRLHRLPEAMGKEEWNEVQLEVGKPALSPRDKFLHFMHELRPTVVILSENDTDHLDSDFISRFRRTVDYFWKFLDSTSYSFHGKQSQERQIIEYEAAMAMVNNVACEGLHRIERNESHRGWSQRMERARFAPVLPKEEILENIRTLVRKYDTNWEFGTDLDCVVLLWKHQPVTFCSVWKPT